MPIQYNAIRFLGLFFILMYIVFTSNAQDANWFKGKPAAIQETNANCNDMVFFYSPVDEVLNVSLSETPNLLIRMDANYLYDVYLDYNTFYPDTVVYVGSVILDLNTYEPIQYADDVYFNSTFLYQDSDGDGIYDLYKTNSGIIPFPEYNTISY